MANLVEDAIRARGAGFDELQGFSENLAQKRAGRRLASDDLAGAADELYGAGMVDAGLGLERVGQQNTANAQAATEKAEDRDIEAQKRNAEFLKQAATVLKQIPADKRQGAFQGSIAPALKSMGMGDDVLAQVVSHLDDASLDTFLGEVDNQIKLFNTSGGVVAINPSLLRQNMQDPNASRVVYQDPSYPAMQQAKIAAQKALVGQRQASAGASQARAARTRATPIGGSGRAVSNSSGLPSGFVLD